MLPTVGGRLYRLLYSYHADEGWLSNNLVKNGGFEDPRRTFPELCPPTVLTDWTVSTNKVQLTDTNTWASG